MADKDSRLSRDVTPECPRCDSRTDLYVTVCQPGVNLLTCEFCGLTFNEKIRTRTPLSHNVLDLTDTEGMQKVHTRPEGGYVLPPCSCGASEYQSLDPAPYRCAERFPGDCFINVRCVVCLSPATIHVLGGGQQMIS